MMAKIPSRSECLELMDKTGMLDNIKAHSIMVAAAAETLVLALQRNSSTISPPDTDLIIAGALLHDIAKTVCLQDNCRHAERGAELCDQLNYPDIPEIVREHVILSDFDPEKCKQGIFRAKELVYYADKRVRHHEIVPLSARLEYIIDHYGNGDAETEHHIRKNFSACQTLEKILFSYLDFPPDQLKNRAEKILQATN